MYCTCFVSQGKVQAWQDSRNQYLRYLSKVLQGKARRAPWWRNTQRCCRCMFLWFLLQGKTVHLESKSRFDSITIYVKLSKTASQAKKMQYQGWRIGGQTTIRQAIGETFPGIIMTWRDILNAPASRRPRPWCCLVVEVSFRLVVMSSLQRYRG